MLEGRSRRSGPEPGPFDLRPRPSGPRVFDRRFGDRLGFTLPTFRDFLAIASSGGFANPKEQQPFAGQVRRVDRPADLHERPRSARITWGGHASFVVQIGGLTFLTDPVWSDKIPGGIPRLTGAGVPWESLPPVDGVVLSHNHYDHMDGPTLKRLPRKTTMFVPARLGDWFRRKGFSDVREFEWWETEDFGSVDVTMTPCQHWSRRGLFDKNKTLWGSWILSAKRPRKRVFFTGDSGYCHWYKEIGHRVPDLDAAILPIGAYAPDWFMQKMHMNPEECVRAFQDLGARHLVPSHWGTFSLTREPFLEPHQRLGQAWQRGGLDREQLWDLALGESRDIHDRP